MSQCAEQPLVNGPNIGHRDDPAFIATEERWAAEIAAAAERFQQVAAYFVRLERVARAAQRRRKAADPPCDVLSPEESLLAAESCRYRERHDAIAEVEVRNYAGWVLAGKYLAEPTNDAAKQKPPVTRSGKSNQTEPE